MHVDNTGYISFNHSTSYVLGMARTVYICTVYDRVISDFPAKNTVYTPYIHGSGQPYIYGNVCMALVNPKRGLKAGGEVFCVM